MKKKNILVAALIIFLVIINAFVLLRRPSKDERQKAINNYISVMKDVKSIEKIEIYYNWERLYEILDKDLINQICLSSKVYYGEERAFDGGYKDWYLFRFKLKDRYYSIRYYKSINHPDIRRKELVKDGVKYSNPYDDCGQLIILENPDCPDQDIEKGCSSGVAILNNIDLIPLLRKYVDPYVKDND